MEIGTAIRGAFWLLITGDAGLLEVIWLSLQVNLTAVTISTAIGLPIGAWLATVRFHGRDTIITITNALMGLPPVVVGLAVYMMVSRAGPFGVFQLLYTPMAMIIAQCILVTPIIIALTRQGLERINADYTPLFIGLGIGAGGRVKTLLADGWLDALTAIFAGLGRAMAEVGAVMIVGGNINHYTRVMTTSITLETARGELATALALGIVLLALTLLINGVGRWLARASLYTI